MRFAVLLLVASLAAAQCEKASWAVDDDGITGVVSNEGKPLKQAKVRLSAPDREYNAITDDKGVFSIRPVALGRYSFAVEGWGQAQLEVRGWHRGGANRPCLDFIKHKKCLGFLLVAN
jgi:Carboxypeptidase regulatory-like domain